MDSAPKDAVEASEALESRFGWLVDWVLSKHGLIIDAASRAKLLAEAGRASSFAAMALKRNADGDYTPDPNALRFPPIESLKRLPSIAPSKTLTELFDHWKHEKKPSPSTVQTWQGHINSLRAFLGHECAAEVTDDKAIEWKDALVAKGLKSVHGSHLACMRSIYKHGVENKLVPSNPFATVKAIRKRQAGESMQVYSDAEVRKILIAATSAEAPYQRWLPWLIATTGARVGEMAQLWGQSITTEDGLPVIIIAPAPDGGTLKNAGSERKVPLHPALIEAGFLDFVKSKGDGPLFYRGGGRRAARAREASESKHPSKGITNRLAGWIRDQGLRDRRKAPAHAFRKWFKTTLARKGVSDRIADIIQGHSNQDVAARYVHADMKTMLEAVSVLPLPEPLASQ